MIWSSQLNYSMNGFFCCILSDFLHFQKQIYTIPTKIDILKMSIRQISYLHPLTKTPYILRGFCHLYKIKTKINIIFKIIYINLFKS
jgi:hypothetical protein